MVKATARRSRDVGWLLEFMHGLLAASTLSILLGMDLSASAYGGVSLHHTRWRCMLLGRFCCIEEHYATRFSYRLSYATNASRRLSGDHDGTLIVPWPPRNGRVRSRIDRSLTFMRRSLTCLPNGWSCAWSSR